MARRGRPPYPDVLTPRQQEVLTLVREGLSNREIADRLEISRDGVKFHVSEILTKIGVTRREEAAQWQGDADRATAGLSCRRVRRRAGRRLPMCRLRRRMVLA
jgi:DNA-binding NarL/FixJ family response regulator